MVTLWEKNKLEKKTLLATARDLQENYKKAKIIPIFPDKLKFQSGLVC